MQRWFAIAGILLLHTGAAQAQQMPYGQAEYMNSCAVCHGVRGKGNGPLAESLKTPPSDLTQLEKNNNGEFPYFRVYAVIDGRFVVPGHGERDMPVWGRQFFDEDMQIYGPSGGEIVAQERVHELANYIQTLQQ